jgi:hypothetical protein
MVSRLKESIAQCYDTKVMLTADVFCFRYDGPRLANLTWTHNLMPPQPTPPPPLALALKPTHRVALDMCRNACGDKGWLDWGQEVEIHSQLKNTAARPHAERARGNNSLSHNLSFASKMT